MAFDMRRKDRQMDSSWALNEISKADFGFLGTVGLDGLPYAVPVNHACYGSTILFHCAKEGRKLDNIRHNPEVSFSVVTQHEVVPEKYTTKYKSAMAFGRARIINNTDRKRELLLLILARLAPNIPLTCDDETMKNTVLVEIEVERATGKALSI